jgi:hypothetical protein
MNEAAWHGSTRLFELFAFASAWLSDRKRRLLAVACCRRFAHLFADRRSRDALVVAERFAEGTASELERQLAEEAAFDAHIEMRESRLGGDGLIPWSRQAELLTHAAALAISVGRFHAEDAADYARWALACSAGWRAEQEEEIVQCRLLREVVGPLPFHPVRIEPAWLALDDQSVWRLARAIYEERAFADLPILADALEEAGCTDARLLDHCREPGEHIPGCWAVDLVLGRP